MTNAATIQLANGVRMPLLGLGTWPMDNETTASAVETAVSAGYRLFDTAESYGNEQGLGEGLRRSGIPRQEVFITSKFNKEWHSIEGAKAAFKASTARLGTDYIDLFLIHWPAPAQDRYLQAFQGLQALLTEGRVRAIGTSNFKPAHLQKLFDAGLTPHVNQIQLDPEHVRPEVQELHRARQIVTGGYSPLGRGGSFLAHPAITEAASVHSKSPSQIVLRWHTQQGIATAVKSADPTRQAENLGSFDFELSTEEINRINALDTGAPARLDADEYAH